MNPLQAWNLHRSITPQQRAFLREKKINLRIKRSEWIGFLGPIARLDRASDKLRTSLVWVAIIGIPCAILFSSILSTPTSLLLLPIAIAALVAKIKLSKLDLPDRLQDFILPVLTLLQEETSASTEISLKLDLRGHAAKDKIVSVTGPKKDSTTVYRDPWVRCELDLQDGSQLQWEIVDLVRTRSRIRINARGKTKHKVKSKIRRVVDVRLRAKTRDYALDAAGAPSNDKIRLDVKEGEKRNLVRIRTLTSLAAAGTSPRPVELVDAVAAAYARLSASIQTMDKK